MGFFDKDILWALVKVVLFFVVATPLIYYFTRIYGNKQLVRHSVVIKERVVLGSNKMLYVVDWEGERLLLGVTSQQINVLHKLDISPASQTTAEEQGGE
ncbi:MAG: flagellar biosynthetic protein FliO [Firmicutes bacterium]|nr:flagellar biosynthetic protein FliO [Bacillota bacterium]